LQPSWANNFAAAAPNPDDAPVIKTTLSLSMDMLPPNQKRPEGSFRLTMFFHETFGTFSAK
jgi:hypothetical protein